MADIDEGAFGDLLEETSPKEKREKKRKDRLVFKTSHLRNYGELDNLIALEGADYIPIIKGTWYALIGIVKPVAIPFSNNIHTDNRFSLSFPLPSGGGKNDVKYATIRVCTECDREVKVPTSFHPEQLIGKMLQKRFHNPEKAGKGLNDTQYIPNYGYLHADCLIFDEAYNFISEKDKLYEESKNYIKFALDPIGRNRISKKLIDELDVPEQRLEYDPTCTIIMFLQPNAIDAQNVKSGFTRRFNTVYVPLVGKNLDNRDGMLKHIKTPRPDVSFEYWQDIRAWRAPTFFGYEDGVNDLLYALIVDDLIPYFRTLGSAERQFLDRKAFALFDDLIGMAVTQAISRKSDVVTCNDVKLAYMDLFEFFFLSLDYVREKVKGSLDYDEKWQGAEAKEIEALEWLIEHGALSEEKSDVTVAEWLRCIAEIFSIEVESARKHHRKLKKAGRIGSRRVGKNSSRVWIAFEPDEIETEPEPAPLHATIYWQIAHERGFPLVKLENDSESQNGTSGQVGHEGSGNDENDESGGTGVHLPTCPTCPTDGDFDSPQVGTYPKVTQLDRMKKVDAFFREHRDKNGGRAEIVRLDREGLVDIVPEIAKMLGVGEDVAFRDVMEYGKHRRWI